MLRSDYLINEFLWRKILHSKKHIFDAVVDTHVIIFEKNKLFKNNFVQIDSVENGSPIFYQNLNQNEFSKDGEIINILAKPEENKLFLKIKENSLLVKDISKTFSGITVYEKGKGIPKQTEELIKSNPYVTETDTFDRSENWLPLMRGSLMNRYTNLWNNNYYVLYGKNLGAPRDSKIFECKEKIIIRQTSDKIIATIITENIICRKNLHILISEMVDHRFILGVLNSKLTNFYYQQINPEKGEVLAEVKKTHVEQLPIPKITSENQQLHDDLVKLVEQMLKAKKEEQSAQSDHEKNLYKNLTDSLDYKINNLVYKLYNLTPEEIDLVENS